MLDANEIRRGNCGAFIWTGIQTFAGLVLALSFPVTAAHATAIVLIRTPTQIVIAADSAVVDSDGSSVGQTCKIRQLSPDLFFTLMGVHTDPNVGFDAFQQIQMVDRRGARNVSERIDGIVADLKPILEGVLTELRRRSPDEFHRFDLGADPPLTVGFGGIEKTNLTLFIRVFRVANVSAAGKVNLEVESHSCPGSDCPQGTIRFLGSPNPESDSQKFHAAYRNTWKDDPALVSEEFLDLVKNERAVSPPFDILRLTPDGAMWVQLKSSCER